MWSLPVALQAPNTAKKDPRCTCFQRHLALRFQHLWLVRLFIIGILPGAGGSDAISETVKLIAQVQEYVKTTYDPVSVDELMLPDDDPALRNSVDDLLKVTKRAASVE
eukprot:6479214-Amphidinium_carterae.1